MNDNIFSIGVDFSLIISKIWIKLSFDESFVTLMVSFEEGVAQANKEKFCVQENVYFQLGE
jgi:hypothetical protein